MTPRTMIRRRRLATGALALALVTTACSSGGDDTGVGVTAVPEAAGTPTEPPGADPAETAPSDGPTTEPTPTDGAEGDAAAPDVVVPEALRFTAPLVGGGEFDGAAYADKPTVFWFWAPT